MKGILKKISGINEDILLLGGSFAIALTVPVGTELTLWAQGNPSWFSQRPAIVQQAKAMRPLTLQNCTPSSKGFQPR